MGREYKNGQVWQADWPMCWTVKLLYVKMDSNGEPLFIVLDVNNTDIFTRPRNAEGHLFTPESITKLLGEKAELLKDVA